MATTQELISLNPSTGEEIGRAPVTSREDYDRAVTRAQRAFVDWRMTPAPKRGQVVREIGDEIRLAKDELGALVSREMGKILAEGRGEVQ